MLSMGAQIFGLLVLAIPIACVAWTVTHEELFREPRDFCVDRSQNCGRWWQRKFYYLFTCEYCFSHYVTLFFLWLARFKLLLPGWRGTLVAFFALVFVANLYMSLFGRLRLDIKRERVEIKAKETVTEEKTDQ